VVRLFFASSPARPSVAMSGLKLRVGKRSLSECGNRSAAKECAERAAGRCREE
jgi:hypothetical protein